MIFGPWYGSVGERYSVGYERCGGYSCITVHMISLVTTQLEEATGQREGGFRRVFISTERAHGCGTTGIEEAVCVKHA